MLRNQDKLITREGEIHQAPLRERDASMTRPRLECLCNHAGARPLWRFMCNFHGGISNCRLPYNIYSTRVKVLFEMSPTLMFKIKIF